VHALAGLALEAAEREIVGTGDLGAHHVGPLIAQLAGELGERVLGQASLASTRAPR
jgi:hypothetical protein